MEDLLGGEAGPQAQRPERPTPPGSLLPAQLLRAALPRLSTLTRPPGRRPAAGSAHAAQPLERRPPPHRSPDASRARRPSPPLAAAGDAAALGAKMAASKKPAKPMGMGADEEEDDDMFAVRPAAAPPLRRRTRHHFHRCACPLPPCQLRKCSNCLPPPAAGHGGG